MELDEALVKTCVEMGRRTSLTAYTLCTCSPDNFKESRGAYSEKQGERLHREVMYSEQRYQGSLSETYWETTFGGSYVKVVCCIHANQDLTVYF